MLIRRGYKTELNPNEVQRTALLQHAGTARFAFNWGLARRQEEYKATGETLNAIALHRELNGLKKTDFPWMYESSKCAPQEALRDLDNAFKRFFKGQGKYPRFKSKKRGIGSFTLTGAIRVLDDRIQLPRIGAVRLKERAYIPTDAHILGVTVSEKAGRWFVSVQVEEEHEVPINTGPVAGVDLGIKNLAAVSDGTVFQNPKSLSRFQRKLKRQQREVSRKQKGSNNRRKAVRRLARIHAKIGNIRKDAIHKATTELARTKSVIVVEDLNVQGMMKNHNLAGSIMDAAWSEFRRQLEYKAAWYGSRVVVADGFYPSSKTCSVCGYVKSELSLSERVFKCEVCHSETDRDLNAAIGLSRLAVSSTERLNACGEARSMPSQGDGRCASANQEVNAIRESVLNG